MNTRHGSEAPNAPGLPAKFCLGRRYASNAALRAVLLVDGARWPEPAHTVRAALRSVLHRAKFAQHCARLRAARAFGSCAVRSKAVW